jgi:hypothetical protein
MAEIETPAPSPWCGESPVDGGRLTERSVRPPHHFITREPPGYRIPPDGPSSATRMSAPRACRTQLLTKGRQGQPLARHQHRRDCMRQPVRTSFTPCRDGFGLVAPAGMVQSFCRIGGHPENVG